MAAVRLRSLLFIFVSPYYRRHHHHHRNHEDNGGGGGLREVNEASALSAAKRRSISLG